ncbi:MAG: Fatty-acid-CoA ligase fadD11 [Solirubrobacterales bacterium]|nr:Fatty-acid-CoA ligase fadD11 [Solirubrobacterales bacterium]
MSTPTKQSATPESGTEHATTMVEAFQAIAARHAGEVALRTPDGATEITFGDYAARVEKLAGGLAALGVTRGDTVALLMSNRPEFHLVDTAAVHLGATPFSVYPTSSPPQITHLLENADCDVIVFEEAFLDRIVAAKGDRAKPAHLVCVDGNPEGTTSLADLEAGGAADFDFAATWQAVTPDDVLTLIYTSGTTGPPKGVELTHANILAQCRAVAEVLPMRPLARITSYLPSAHIADRWSSHYNQMVYGLQVTSVSDPRAVAAALPAVRPTVWGAVPRVLEKMKAGLELALAAEPDEGKRNAVAGAIAAARQKVRLDQAGQPVPEELAKGVAQAEAMIFSKLREKMGLDQVEWLIVGAAPMSKDVQEFLTAIGLPLTEIYGMSECSCCITVSHPSEAKVGTVGPAISCVETRLAEDGELLVRGATVTRGYRGQPEKTAEAIDGDGWLHTGDICEVDDGYIRIVDRKKELIINAAGKNMSPANIEQELKTASPLIGQAAVIGESRPYIVALLVLDPDVAAAKATQLGIGSGSVADVARHPDVLAAVGEAVERANANLSRVEQIKRWELLAEEWLPGGDELTPTMKLKRKPIAEKHAEAIEALYAPS